MLKWYKLTINQVKKTLIVFDFSWCCLTPHSEISQLYCSGLIRISTRQTSDSFWKHPLCHRKTTTWFNQYLNHGYNNADKKFDSGLACPLSRLLWQAWVHGDKHIVPELMLYIKLYENNSIKEQSIIITLKNPSYRGDECELLELEVGWG